MFRMFKQCFFLSKLRIQNNFLLGIFFPNSIDFTTLVNWWWYFSFSSFEIMMMINFSLFLFNPKGLFDFGKSLRKREAYMAKYFFFFFEIWNRNKNQFYFLYTTTIITITKLKEFNSDQFFDLLLLLYHHHTKMKTKNIKNIIIFIHFHSLEHWI